MGAAILPSLIGAAGQLGGQIVGAGGEKAATEAEVAGEKEIELQKRQREKAELEESARQFDVQAEMQKAQQAGDIEKFNRLQDLQTQTQNLETQKFEAIQSGDTAKFNAIQEAQRELQQAGMAERGVAFGEDIRRYGLGRKEDIRRYELGLGEADILRSSYQKALERAGLTGTRAGEEFMREAGTTAPELEQLKRDIRERGTETMQDVAKQTAARLAAGGVRGGQAATQMRRGIGEVGKATQRDLNAIIAQDALRRQAERMAYQKALGLGAEAFMLSPESARQYETGETFAGLAEDRPAAEAIAPTTGYPALPAYTPLKGPDYSLPELTYEPMAQPDYTPTMTTPSDVIDLPVLPAESGGERVISPMPTFGRGASSGTGAPISKATPAIFDVKERQALMDALKRSKQI
jgi:hypothetical protein